MELFLLFIEGIVTFISPCLLPMLPVYLLYFAGDSTAAEGGGDIKRTLKNALGFVCGFTLLFTALGALSSVIGAAISAHRTIINIVTGAIVVLFGLNYAGLLRIGFLNRTVRHESAVRPTGFFSSLLFGIVFAVGWTPCVGAFLGTALLTAATQGSVMRGILMLAVYSLGLGIPFILSALLIGRLSSLFALIKRNYTVINRVCGALLIIVGILIMTGVMS